MKTTIQQLAEFGQSAWLDNISRSMLENNNLKQMISLGLRGMTSNPTIFDKAISSTADYDQNIMELCRQGKSVFEIYDDLTVKDVQGAADIFLPVYRETQGLDGYVSLEVNPNLAFKYDETVKEAQRLSSKVNRPNVMFKIPATEPGLQAVEELISQGVNTNVTLIFSLKQYIDTARAYLRGMLRLLQAKKDPANVRSVASVFVSRIDTAVDNLLEQVGANPDLKGRAAKSNCALIYKEYFAIFSSEEFKRIEAKAVAVQRLLWGSTSTKNPHYSDIKYITELIGKGTINTMPEQTFNAFLDHGKARGSLAADTQGAENLLAEIKHLGIDIDEVCGRLLQEGVTAFEKSFASLLSSLDRKMGAVCKP